MIPTVDSPRYRDVVLTHLILQNILHELPGECILKLTESSVVTHGAAYGLVSSGRFRLAF